MEPPALEVVRARVVFEYTSTSPYELSISEGETVKVLEEDDGSGWIKVANSTGGKGLVPASYVEVISAEGSKSDVTPRTSAQYGALVCFHRLPSRLRSLPFPPAPVPAASPHSSRSVRLSGYG